MGFSSPGGDSAPIKVTFGTGERTVKVHLYRDRNVGIQSLKLSKFGILTTKSPLRGDSFAEFYEIFSVCTHLYVAFKFLIWSLLGDKQPSYKRFPVVWAFSHKFSIAPCGETTDRIKTVTGGAKMARTSSITVPSVVGIVGRAPAVDEKLLFCLFFLFVTLWNCEVCNNGNASIIFKTTTIPLHRGRFVVMHRP